MLIFELQDNVIKLSSKLVGSVLAANPEGYIYFMNFWEYDEFSRQLRRLRGNSSAHLDKEQYQMIAASAYGWMVDNDEDEVPVFAIMDSPYCLLWLLSTYRGSVINCAIELAGGILDAKQN